MSDLIDRHKAIRGILSMDVCVIYDDMCSTEEAVEKAIVATKRTAIFGLECMPSAEPKTQKLLDDGTLVVHTDIDIIKITRVNIAQNNTHYGDLFYRDEE